MILAIEQGEDLCLTAIQLSAGTLNNHQISSILWLVRINFVAVSIRRLLLLRQNFPKLLNYWIKLTKGTVSFWRAAYYSNRKWYCLTNSTYRWTCVYLFSSFLISLCSLRSSSNDVCTFVTKINDMYPCSIRFVLFVDPPPGRSVPRARRTKFYFSPNTVNYKFQTQ